MTNVSAIVEYVLWMINARHPGRYALSFFGLVDPLSILPTFFSLILSGAQSPLVIRTLRLPRVFRVLKLGHFLAVSIPVETFSRAGVSKSSAESGV
jgi:voltage-gated potassium channel